MRKEAYDLINKNIKLNNFQDKIKTYLGKIDEENNLDFYLRTTKKVPTIIKIDIEGDEMKALAGSRKILKKYHPKIILETHSKELKKECLDFLFKLKYAVKHRKNFNDKITLLFLEKNQR